MFGFMTPAGEFTADTVTVYVQQFESDRNLTTKLHAVVTGEWFGKDKVTSNIYVALKW